MTNTSKIFYILDKKYNLKLILILFLTLIMTLLELFSIALIIPLISSLVGSGEEVFLYDYLRNYFELDDDKLLVIVLSLFIFIFFIKNCFLVFFNSVKIKFTYQLFVDLSNKIFKNYLLRDYSSFIKQNSSKFIRNVSGECNVFSFGIIMSYITLVSDLIIVFFISLFLLYYNFFSSLFVILFIVILSGFLLRITNNKFKRWGVIRLEYASKIIQNLQESYGYIKEIIFSGSQKYFIDRHLKNNNFSTNASVKRDVFSLISRPILETVALIAFYILILISLFLDINKTDILVLIGVIFFASIKLLPSITNIIKSIQSIRFNLPVVNVLYNELSYQQKNSRNKDIKKFNKNFKKIVFKKVNFFYDEKEKKILDNLNLEIKKNDRIGIMGKSGEGKTTFLNLLSGLLYPTSGQINIDNNSMKLISNQWKRNISYVHQNVFLADDTVLFNLILKKTANKKELEKIWKILKIVELDNYVKRLKKGLYTVVGERGSKLSGGQSQRLGIARSLLRDHSILIFDEATSALDEETQKRVLKSIYFQMKQKTIITVSHRANTLKYCRKVLKLVNGKLIKK